MRWCCDKLELAFAARSQRGIYVYAESPQPQIGVCHTFWLGMRSVEDDILIHGQLLDLPREGDPVTLETWQRIIFCPWCGRNLEKFYRRTFQHLCDDAVSKRRCTDVPGDSGG